MELYTSMYLRSSIEGVKHNTPNFFQIVPWILLDLAWKFHKNPFMRFPIMLLTDKPTNRDENITLAVRRR